MHVLGVTDYLGNVGGAELSAHTILNGLKSHESVDKVTVIGVDLPGTEQLDYSHVNIVPVHPPRFIENLPTFGTDLIMERHLARVIRQHIDDADIVHAHHRRSSLALAHVDAPCPTLSTVRDYWPTCPISIYHVGSKTCTGCENQLDECVAYQNWDGPLEPGIKTYLLAKRRHQRSVIGSQDTAIFIAKHLRDKLQGEVAFPPRTEVIYNPVSLNVNLEPTPFDAPTFITASSLNESKGVETAVRAMGKISERIPNVRLIVKGDGPKRDTIESIANEVAPDSVEFHGRVPPEEVYRAIAGATGTIFPSLWDEPFGRITVESMMLGTPVIGSNVGGIAEVITDGESGLLFPAGDVDALADRIKLLIQNEGLRRKLATVANDATKRFRPKTVVQTHVNLYKSLVNSEPPV